MQLINWQGALVGPGSEWFWSMLQFIVIAGTLIGLYRQLRLQSSQGAIEQLDAFEREWASERNIRHRLNILVALRDGTDSANIPRAAAYALANFWEKVGSLTRGGHIHPRLLWNVSGNDCQEWWAILVPFVRLRRSEAGGDPTIYEHFERLAGLLAEMDRRAGVPPIFDEATVASWRGGRITQYQHQLRVEQALRTVVLASPDKVTVGEPPVQATAAQA
jgi:hypothetical protein